MDQGVGLEWGDVARKVSASLTIKHHSTVQNIIDIDSKKGDVHQLLVFKKRTTCKNNKKQMLRRPKKNRGGYGRLSE